MIMFEIESYKPKKYEALISIHGTISGKERFTQQNKDIC